MLAACFSTFSGEQLANSTFTALTCLLFVSFCSQRSGTITEDTPIKDIVDSAPKFYACTAFQLELNEIRMMLQSADCPPEIRRRLFGRIADIKAEYRERNLGSKWKT